MTKQQIIVVVHSNYAEGTTDAYAFWDEKIAKESVNADVETEVKSLTEEGYKPAVLRRPSGVTVFVPDSGIYYEWEILNTTLE